MQIKTEKVMKCCVYGIEDNYDLITIAWKQGP